MEFFLRRGDVVLVERLKERDRAIEQAGKLFALFGWVGAGLESKVIVNTLAFLKGPDGELENVRARSMEHKGQADFGLADMLILEVVGIEDDVDTPSG